MSDHFYGKITIGGILKTESVEELANSLGITEAHFPTLAIPGKPFEHEDDQARYGEFTETEDLCQQLGLPYISEASSYAEYEACERHFDGQEMRERMLTSGDAEPSITLRELTAAAAIPNGVQELIDSHRFFENGVPALYIVSNPRETMNASGEIREWVQKQPVPEFAMRAISNFTENADAGS